MRKGVDGGYGGSAFLGIWVERITLLMRRLVRPYFRVGFILSVCLSVCSKRRRNEDAQQCGKPRILPKVNSGSLGILSLSRKGFQAGQCLKCYQAKHAEPASQGGRKGRFSCHSSIILGFSCEFRWQGSAHNLRCARPRQYGTPFATTG